MITNSLPSGKQYFELSLTEHKRFAFNEQHAFAIHVYLRTCVWDELWSNNHLFITTCLNVGSMKQSGVRSTQQLLESIGVNRKSVPNIENELTLSIDDFYFIK